MWECGSPLKTHKKTKIFPSSTLFKKIINISKAKKIPPWWK